jgi:glycosyltransferase 2 family protein
MKKKSVRLALGLLVTVLALWLSLRNQDWTALMESFSRINLLWVAAAVLNTLLTVYILGWRWKVMLKSKIDIPMGYMFQLNIMAQYLNIAIPARLGELAKSWLPAKRYGISGSYVLGTVLIEKMFDFFAGVMLWIIVPAVFAFQDKVRAYTLAAGVCVVMIFLLVFVIWKRELVRRWLFGISRLLPGKFRERVVGFLERGLEAFGMLKDRKTALVLAMYTVLILMMSSLTNLLLFRAYGFDLTIIEAIILLLMLQVGNAPPSIPGKVGIFEWMVIWGLSFFGIQRPDALAYGLMLHAVSHLPKIILGFIFMARLNISLKKAEVEFHTIEQEAAQDAKNNPAEEIG